MDIEVGLGSAIHRFAHRLVDLEAGAAGRIADREIIAVASPHAEGPVAASAHGHVVARGHVATVAEEDVAEPIAVGRRGTPAEAHATTATLCLVVLALELAEPAHDRRAGFAGASEEEAAAAVLPRVVLCCHQFALDAANVAAASAAAPAGGAVGRHIVRAHRSAKGRLGYGVERGQHHAERHRQSEKRHLRDATHDKIERHRSRAPASPTNPIRQRRDA